MRSHWTNRTSVKGLTTPLILAAGLLVACDRENAPTAPITPPIMQQDTDPSYLLEELTTEEQSFLDEANTELVLTDGRQAVVGSGAFTDGQTFVQRATVAAFRHPDGTFSGHYIIRERAFAEGDRTIHGDVICLFIAGNRALIFGTGDPGTPPTPGLVDVQTIQITDNGHGGDGLPDQLLIGYVQLPPERLTPAECTVVFGGVDPVTQGNYIVKP